MRWNSVLRENMGNEKFREFGCIYRIIGRNEYRLFGEPIDNHQNIGESVRRRELFNKIHRNRIPRTFGDRKLLKEAVRLMSLTLVPFACGTGLNEIQYKSSEIQPRILLAY